MKKISAEKIFSLFLALAMLCTLLAQAGCTKAPASEPTDSETIAPEDNDTPNDTPSDKPSDAPSDTPSDAPSGDNEPSDSNTYSISYNLDGGIGAANPTSYTNADEFTLALPIKAGYDFAGWTGTGLSEPTKLVTVKKGTVGELSYTATWSANGEDISVIEKDTSNFNKDNGISAVNGKLTTTPSAVGVRGEGIYTVKTVYTEIKSDAVKDAAYSYGVHWHGEIPYNNAFPNVHSSAFDLYMIHGQDGRLHVYIEVTDDQLVANKTVWKVHPYHCDSIDLNVDYNNTGVKDHIYSIVAPNTDNLIYSSSGSRTVPTDWSVKKTSKGYDIEFSFDNNGVAFAHNDEVGLGFFLNDAYYLPNVEGYKKTTVKARTLLDPDLYVAPDPMRHDAIKISLDSATGKVDTSVEIPDKTGDTLADILSGATAVGVIYDDNATSQTIDLANYVNKLLIANGARSTLLNESSLPSGLVYEYEILIGMTSRADTQIALSDAKYTEAYLSINNRSMVLLGWNETGAADLKAFTYEIIEHIVNGGKTNELGSVYRKQVDRLVGSDIPMLEGFDYVTDAGEDAYLIYKLNASKSDYNNYRVALLELGYQNHTSNLMGNVDCSTYYKDDTVVNVTFSNNELDKSLRVVVEPLSKTNLPEITPPSDASSAVTVSSITQMAPQNLCIVIQLSNGEFVIIDSGNNKTQGGLSEFLKSKAPNGKPIIAAWIMTHFHQDHIGGFIDFVNSDSCMKDVTIESVIYNFPQKQVCDTAYGATDQSNLAKWQDTLAKTNAKIYQARTGQKYYFGNATVEILWTFEDIMPFNIFYDRTNPTCIGFSVSLEGQKLLVTGDSSEEELTAACNRFGDYLKSDFVQLSHHGKGDVHSPQKFYELVDAKYVLNPGTGVNDGAAEQWAVSNATAKGGKVFVRDELGICTIPLPYYGGNVTSEK